MSDPRPVLNESALQRLEKVGGRAFVLRMASLFRDHARQQMELAKEASRDGSAEELEKAAHSIRSSAGNLGAERLLAAATRIEHGVRTGEEENLSSCVEELDHELERTWEQILQRLPELKEGGAAL